jgi:2,4-dienoyl-CoA reductase-like NADH-dependent reductase (Old Yellow Enzyme family)
MVSSICRPDISVEGCLQQPREQSMSDHQALFSPLTIRGRTIRNRLLSTSHAPGYAENGLPGERYQAYHEEKAKGGIGLTMFGGSSNISRESGSIYGQIYVGSDTIIPVFQGFAKRIQRHGSALMCQITHMGRRTAWNSGDWVPTMGASVIRDPAHHSVPYVASRRDIARVTGDFAEAAWRCREGGLDGCEILATVHLLGQFLSPLSNTREDEYGGSMSQRARFLLEVLAAARQRVGDEFILGVRLAFDESNENGMPVADGLALAAMIGAERAVDFINVNGAYGGTDHGLAENFPGMAFRSAPYIELARKVKGASGLLVFQASRISDPATANWAVESGMVDMAGLTRPHIADPHIAIKLQRGEESRIRACVGAGYCMDRIYGGRESLPHAIPAASTKRRAVVIGGGPAGMEAARVLALRGHDVTLFEAGPQLGGQIILAARAGWRKDMIGISDWLAAEIKTLGVTVKLNCLADAPAVLAELPDVVIVATGGIPDTSLPEGGEDLVTTTWQILAGEVAPAKDLIVYDETGEHGAISTADMLACSERKLEFVTPDRQPGREVGAQNFPISLRNLYKGNAVLTPNHRLLAVHRESSQLVATFWNEFSRVRVERRTDQIIVDRCTLPADEVFQMLKDRSRNFGEVDIDCLVNLQSQPSTANPDGEFMLFRVGDALAGRDIHAAILDSNRICRAV